ncbi:MAG: hypothetical protein AVO35_07920 [Candidatus Aegiribacteria sp. MLS_C]|nr:MAG: hypothetical protein AVO35_07920 [Candidatus Aegiribacteria sp. MLS_C]
MEDYIFVSHSSSDDRKVRRLVEFLEDSGFRCWVSYRDIPPGADWAETIYDAIAGSSGMVLVFSGHANDSRQIRNELDIATNLKKTIIPIKLEDIELSKGLKYFTGSHQWLDASGGWKEVRGRLLESLGNLPGIEPRTPPASLPGRRCRRIWVAAALIILLSFLAAGAFIILRSPGSSGDVRGLLNMVAGGTDSWDYATDIIAGTDGGFTATGTWDWGFWSEWWITRFDGEGRIMWTWSDSLAGEDKPRLLKAGTDGLICAAGEYADFDHTGFPVRAVRLDSAGGEVWDQEWWLEWEGAVQPELASMDMADDSLVYLFFTLRQISSTCFRANHQVVIDASGGFVSRDTLGESNTARDLVVLENGDLLRVFRDLPSRANGVETVSPTGDLMDRIVIGDARSHVSCGLELPGGDILLAMTRDTYGSGRGDLSVMRFSPDLELLWERSYGGSMPDVINDALLMPAGDVLLAGYTGSWGSGSRDGWLIRLDQEGRQQWHSVVDMGGEDYLSAVSRAADGTIWAAGGTSMYGQPDAWVIRFTEDGRWNPETVTGVDIFAEDWERGFIDQTVWEMGFNRNYSPVLHRDSISGNWSFDANNVSVVSIARFPLVPGLCLSADITVPDMPVTGGNNWVAFGMTGGSADDFLLDPGMVSDMELRWVYTPGGNGQVRGLETRTISDGSVLAFCGAESLWLERGVPQRLTIETCSRTVRFWAGDRLFHEDSVGSRTGCDTVGVYIWGNSGSLPHHVDDLRLCRRRW